MCLYSGGSAQAVAAVVAKVVAGFRCASVCFWFFYNLRQYSHVPERIYAADSTHLDVVAQNFEIVAAPFPLAYSRLFPAQILWLSD